MWATRQLQNRNKKGGPARPSSIWFPPLLCIELRQTDCTSRALCMPPVPDVVGLQGPWSCRLPASATLHPLLVRPYEFASILRPLLHRLAWTLQALSALPLLRGAHSCRFAPE